METEPKPPQEIKEFRLPVYSLTDEQLVSLPTPALLGYHLMTDAQLQEFVESTQDILERMQELTDLDEDSIKAANRILSAGNDKRAKHAVLNKTKAGMRFEMTSVGVQSLEKQIEGVGGTVLMSQIESARNN